MSKNSILLTTCRSFYIPNVALHQKSLPRPALQLASGDFTLQVHLMRTSHFRYDIPL
jgi:hypothetical protein